MSKSIPYLLAFLRLSTGTLRLGEQLCSFEVFVYPNVVCFCSGPWPWQDQEFDDQGNSKSSKSTAVSEGWPGYPTAQYPNWLAPQVARSGITKAIESRQKVPCQIYYCDILDDGRFDAFGKQSVANTNSSQDNFWNLLQLKVGQK